EIASHGSSTAFNGLADSTADIGMSSRRIKPTEATKLVLLGDMTSPTKEHVLALDGIAVIVNRNNPIKSLTKDQIAAIFAGVITDWAELKRAPGTIKLYARDNKSGTYDTFKSVVLNNLKLSHDVRLFEDSVMLSDKVATDPDGIGFVGLPFVRSARALAVSENGTAPLLPNRLTIATEDYPLARRLYLYTPDKPENPHVRKFTHFVLSKAGQDIVKQFGFVELNVQTSKVAVQQNAPDEYARLTSGAQRLSLNFRFMPGSHKLDNKSVRDLDRVIEFIEHAKAANQSIMLFGFSDSVGDEIINRKLSQDRAQAVAEELARRGVKLSHVSGYGSSLPVADNRTPEGRERNRRVEIWVKI
ncbi:MAG: phosphate ABC transporter substrate-binding/OmpA family protein, partial [Burkholderiaceae bacterium]|nr:phosphate ABC transporter substrate-binding/OmpA family protein [Burkholderiaceae bacterium]